MLLSLIIERIHAEHLLSIAKAIAPANSPLRKEATERYENLRQRLVHYQTLNNVTMKACETSNKNEDNNDKITLNR